MINLNMEDSSILFIIFHSPILAYVMKYLLTAILLTPGGSSTVTHLHTNNTQNNTIKQNTQNGTYITIRIHTHNNKNT